MRRSPLARRRLALARRASPVVSTLHCPSSTMLLARPMRASSGCADRPAAAGVSPRPSASTQAMGRPCSVPCVCKRESALGAVAADHCAGDQRRVTVPGKGPVMRAWPADACRLRDVVVDGAARPLAGNLGALGVGAPVRTVRPRGSASCSIHGPGRCAAWACRRSSLTCSCHCPAPTIVLARRVCTAACAAWGAGVRTSPVSAREACARLPPSSALKARSCRACPAVVPPLALLVAGSVRSSWGVFSVACRSKRSGLRAAALWVVAV